jgi:hypothetical protein
MEKENKLYDACFTFYGSKSFIYGRILLIIAAIYLALGVIRHSFLMKGLNKIDEGAHGSTIGFKIIIIPGDRFLAGVVI